MNRWKIVWILSLAIVAIVLVVCVIRKATSGQGGDMQSNQGGFAEDVTPTVSLTPTPTAPSKKPGDKEGLSSVEGLDLTSTPAPTAGVAGDGQAGSTVDEYGWDGSDLTGALNITKLNEVAAKLYEESLGSGYVVRLESLTEEDMVKFETGSVYYNDYLGYLYLNMKLTVTDTGGNESLEYMTAKIGYEGTKLKFYDIVHR